MGADEGRDGQVSHSRLIPRIATNIFRQTKVHVTHKKTSDNEPPVGYVCYRCGETGHYIKECPTNDDPNFESKPRLKRTTGIPRSFLKTVEKPNLQPGDGTEGSKMQGIMVNAEGQFVIAEPDKKSWEQFQAKTKSSAAALKAAEAGDVELKDRGLECPIDKKIFLDPMKTPCCEKTYCSECITNALIENDLVCPNCQTEGVLMDNLIEDHETAKKVTAYEDERKAAAAAKERSKSPSVKPESPPAAATVALEKAKSKSPTPNVKSPPKSPSKSTATPVPEKAPVNGNTAAPKSKKRPAEELLENPKIPKGPKAMQQQEAQKQAMLQQQMMNGMPGGFPNMAPFNPMNMPGQFFPNGFQGMPNMNMNMMNGFNMPMGRMGMNPMMGFGYPNMFAGGGGGGNFGMGNMNMNGNGGAGRGGAATGFPNQQKTVFAEPLPNEEDNAYFRKPVNPHRHQGRAKRARPSDFKEL